MKTPGFNAELSLHRSNNNYRFRGIYSQTETEAVSPSMSLSFEFYGNYCGPGHGDPTGRTQPIDDVDACCREHDLCYEPGYGYSDCYCDKKIIDCLMPKINLSTPKGRAAWAMFTTFALRLPFCDYHYRGTITGGKDAGREGATGRGGSKPNPYILTSDGWYAQINPPKPSASTRGYYDPYLR